MAIVMVGLFCRPAPASAQVTQLFVAGHDGSFGEYNSSSSFSINWSCPILIGYLNGVAIFEGDLYGANTNSGAVMKINQADGTITDANFIPVVGGPWSVAMDAGNDIFVGTQSSGVNEYNVNTGALEVANFTTSTIFDYGLSVMNGNLYTFSNNGTVSVFNAATGALINPTLITGAFGQGFTVSPLGIFVAGGGGVKSYSLSGTLQNSTLVSGLGFPSDVAVQGNDLFVADYSGGTVGEYNATTGAAINTHLITGLTHPFALATVPEPSTWALIGGAAATLLAVLRRRRAVQVI
jgi:WD40 repeat protein